MSNNQWVISDVSRMTGLEPHVLRYWEKELELDIPRNQLGHRYYLDSHVEIFKKVHELKEAGYQLKAIKRVIGKSQLDKLTGDILEDITMEQEADHRREMAAIDENVAASQEAVARQSDVSIGENLHERADRTGKLPGQHSLRQESMKLESLKKQKFEHQTVGSRSMEIKQQKAGVDSHGDKISQDSQLRKMMADYKQKQLRQEAEMHGNKATEAYLDADTKTNAFSGTSTGENDPIAKQNVRRTDSVEVDGKRMETAHTYAANENVQQERAKGKETSNTENVDNTMPTGTMAGKASGEEAGVTTAATDSRTKISAEEIKNSGLESAEARTAGTSTQQVGDSINKMSSSVDSTQKTTSDIMGQETDQEESQTEKNDNPTIQKVITMPNISLVTDESIKKMKESEKKSGEDKVEQFKQILGDIILETMDRHSEEMERRISEKVIKQIDYRLRVQEEMQEEHFKLLDETIRAYQRDCKQGKKHHFFMKRVRTTGQSMQGSGVFVK